MVRNRTNSRASVKPMIPLDSSKPGRAVTPAPPDKQSRRYYGTPDYATSGSARQMIKEKGSGGLGKVKAANKKGFKR